MKLVANLSLFFKKALAIAVVASLVWPAAGLAATEYNTNIMNKLDLSQAWSFSVNSSGDYVAPTDGWVFLNLEGKRISYREEDDSWGDGYATVVMPDGSKQTFVSGTGSSAAESAKQITLYVPKGTKMNYGAGTVEGVFFNSSDGTGEDKNLLVNGTTQLNGATSINSSLAVAGNAGVGGSLAVAGDAVVAGGLGVCGSAEVAGNATVKQGLSVGGDAVVAGTVSGGSFVTSGSYVAGSTVVDSSGVSVAGTRFLSESGVNAGGKVVSNVANAASVSDAAAFGQTAGSMSYAGNVLTLKDRNGNVIDSATISAESITGAVVYDDSTKGSVTFTGSNGTVLANVADGAVGQGSKQAVTGSQLYTEQSAREAADLQLGQVTSALNAELSNVQQSEVMRSGITADKVYRYDNYDSRITANAVNIEDVRTSVGTKAEKSAVVTDVAATATGKLTQTKGNGSVSQIAQLSGNTVTSAALAAKQLVVTQKDAYSGAVSTVTADLSALETGTKVITDDVTFEGDGKNVDIQTVVDPEDPSRYIANITMSEDVTDISTITTKEDGQGRKTVVSADGVSIADGAAVVASDRVTVGSSALTDSGLVVGGTEYISTNGLNAANKKIANVADGTIASGSSDAVNGGQLYKATSVSVNGANVNEGNGVQFIAGENVTLTNKGNAITISATGSGSGAGAVKYDYDPTTQTGDNSVTFYDKNGKTEVTGGSRVTLKNIAIEASAIGSDNKVSGMKAIAFGYGNNASGLQSIAIGYGNNVSGNDSGAIGDPNVVSGNESYVLGNNNTVTGNNTFVVGNNVSATVSNAVILGAGSTATQDNVVSVGSKGNERKIVNVASGEVSATSTDAVTGSQLYSEQEARKQADNELAEAIAKNTGGNIAELRGQMEDIAAQSAALAGLRFMEPTGEEGDKFVGAVSYGGYKGKSAGAVGVAYKPSDNVMLNAGTSFGNGDSSYNAGISFKLGKGATKQSASTMQRKEIQALNQRVAMLEQFISQNFAQRPVPQEEVMPMPAQAPAQRVIYDTNTADTVFESIEDLAGM